METSKAVIKNGNMCNVNETSAEVDSVVQNILPESEILNKDLITEAKAPLKKRFPVAKKNASFSRKLNKTFNLYKRKLPINESSSNDSEIERIKKCMSQRGPGFYGYRCSMNDFEWKDTSSDLSSHTSDDEARPLVKKMILNEPAAGSSKKIGYIVGNSRTNTMSNNSRASENCDSSTRDLVSHNKENVPSSSAKIINSASNHRNVIQEGKTGHLPKGDIHEGAQHELEKYKRPALSLSKNHGLTSETVEDNIQQQILDYLIRIEAKIDNMSIRIDQIWNSLQVSTMEPESHSLIADITIPHVNNTLEELKHFNESLKCDKEFSKWVIRLAFISGGYNDSACIRRILSHIITNTLAKEINWIGRTKCSFQNFPYVLKLIYATVRKDKRLQNLTEFAIERVIKVWFSSVGSKERKNERMSKEFVHCKE